jgi:hypothetical protein
MKLLVEVLGQWSGLISKTPCRHPAFFSVGQNSTQVAIMVNRPPPSFIYGRPPFRAATTPRRNPPHQRTQRTRFVAARRS